MTPRTTVLNGRFDAWTSQRTVDAVFDALDEGRRGWLCTVNVATLMTMRRQPWLQSFVDRAMIVVADGQPIVWTAPLFGGRLPERVAGIDLVDALCAEAARRGRGVYCLGATPTVVAGAVARLRDRHRGLVVAGSDGYFPPGQAAARASAIRATGASLLFVGMGTPLQERFIEQQWDRLGPLVAVGVGGSFDVLAGTRRRAHPRLAGLGLEWLVRLAQEPVRLMPRYLTTNTRFCALIAGAALTRLGLRRATR